MRDLKFEPSICRIESPSRIFFQLLQGRLDFDLEIRQVMFNCVPNNVGINSEIVVDKNVPHAHDLCPWNVRLSIPQLSG